MQASPHPCDIYPPEIIEWSAMQADPDHRTERQERASDILTDDDVMRAAPHVLDVMLADNDRWQGEDRATRLAGFWRFIEEGDEEESFDEERTRRGAGILDAARIARRH